MRSYNSINKVTSNVIDNFGNNGKIIHIADKQVAYDEDGIPKQTSTYYDEDGNEVDIDTLEAYNIAEVRLTPDEIKEYIKNNDQLYDRFGKKLTITELKHEFDVKYIVKNLRGNERIPNSNFNEQLRVTIKTPQEVRKQDIFVSFRGYRYSIEQVSYIGQTGDGTLIIELICIRI